MKLVLTTKWINGFIHKYEIKHPHKNTLEAEIRRLSKFTAIDEYKIEDGNGNILHEEKDRSTEFKSPKAKTKSRKNRKPKANIKK